MRFVSTFPPDSDLHYCEITNRFHLLLTHRHAQGLDPQWACGITPQGSWAWMELMRVSGPDKSDLIWKMSSDPRGTHICPVCWRFIR